jgi:divalent metal cation (Fe/Co/Zn/Cd) transporter
MEGNEKNVTHIRGLFGPAQTLWTFFMFLHFFVAGTFLLFGMFAYSNYTLKEPMMMDLVIMFFMVIVWFLLYVIARQLREKGNDQMNDLENEFEKILAS